MAENDAGVRVQTETEMTSEEAHASYSGPQWSQWTRRMVTIALIIAAVYGLTLLGPVIQTLMLSFILAFILFLPARAITRRTHIPYAATVIGFYLVLILLIVLFLVVFIPALVRLGDDLISGLEDNYEDLKHKLEEYEPGTEDGQVTIAGQTISFDFVIEPLKVFVLGEDGTEEGQGTNGDELLDKLQIDVRDLVNSLSGIFKSLTGTLTSAVSGIAGFVVQTFLVLVLSFLFLVDIPRTYNKVFETIPKRYHREYAVLLGKIAHVWVGFFKGQMFLGFLVGFCTFVQLVVMGIPGAPLLAISTGAVSLIPRIGGLIAQIPLAIAPLLLGSSALGDLKPAVLVLVVVGVNVIIQEVIWEVVSPKVMGEAMDLPVALILVGVVVGGAVGGVLGAFLTGPILGSLRIIIEYVLAKLDQNDPFPGEAIPPNLYKGLFAPIEKKPRA